MGGSLRRHAGGQLGAGAAAAFASKATAAMRWARSLPRSGISLAALAPFLASLGGGASGAWSPRSAAATARAVAIEAQWPSAPSATTHRDLSTSSTRGSGQVMVLLMAPREDGDRGHHSAMAQRLDVARPRPGRG